MKFVIQRVTEASVKVDGVEIGAIDNGFMVLIGVSDEDNETIADKMIRKLLGLRIFEDENGKTNVSLRDANGSLLLISQFTLYADCKKGNRPSFIKAGAPDAANALYEYIIAACRKELDLWRSEDGKAADIHRVEKGSFGADMKVSLLNNGPFTIILDSAEIC